jgi:hypothetical protein
MRWICCSSIRREVWLERVPSDPRLSPYLHADRLSDLALEPNPYAPSSGEEREAIT